MKACLPNYLMIADAGEDKKRHAFWHFRLRALDGGDELEVSDLEPHSGTDRLELLALVRGLEALEQPSQVTLVTSSRYVREGIRFGLREWRCNEWRWERFGESVSIQNADLWRRVDQALQFHRLECGPAALESTSSGTKVAATSPPDSKSWSRLGKLRRFLATLFHRRPWGTAFPWPMESLRHVAKTSAGRQNWRVAAAA